MEAVITKLMNEEIIARRDEPSAAENGTTEKLQAVNSFKERSSGSKTKESEAVNHRNVGFPSRRTVIMKTTRQAEEPTSATDDEIEIVYEAKRVRTKKTAAMELEAPGVEPLSSDPYHAGKDNSILPVEFNEFDEMLYPDAVFLYERILSEKWKKETELLSREDRSAFNYYDIETEDDDDDDCEDENNQITFEQYEEYEAIAKEWQAENKPSESNPEAKQLRENEKIVNEKPDQLEECHPPGPVRIQQTNEKPDQLEECHGCHPPESERIQKTNETAKHKRYKYDPVRGKKRLANETPKQREKRLAAYAKRHKKIVATETPEGRKQRLFISAERYRQKRARETPEQRAKRLKDDTDRRRVKREKRRLLSDNGKAREEETPEERERRIAFYEEMYRRIKARETPLEKNGVNYNYAESFYRRLIASETAEEREQRLLRDAEKRNSLRAREVKERMKK